MLRKNILFFEIGKLLHFLSLIIFSSSQCPNDLLSIDYFNDGSNYNQQGAANKNNMEIYEGANGYESGSLWFNHRGVRIYPKFELQTTVRIRRLNSVKTETDGFTMIFTQTKNPALSPGNGNLGYDSIVNALVIEVDLLMNRELNDMYLYSISLHKCYNIVCTAKEGSNTIQAKSPINFLGDERKDVDFSFIISYSYPSFKIINSNRDLIISSDEDLFNNFKGWAYFGYTASSPSTNKSKYTISVFNSIFCEDKLSNDIDFTWKDGNKKDTISIAGAQLTSLMQLRDTSGQPMPHFYNLNMINWELKADNIKCGELGLAIQDEMTISLTISNCKVGGTYDVNVNFNGKDFSDLTKPTYTIISRAFELLSLIEPVTNKNGVNYLQQQNSENFSIDSLQNNTISFTVKSSDIFTNLFNLDKNSFEKILDIKVTNSNGTPATIKITNLDDNYNFFKIDALILTPGIYTVTGNKLDKGPFYIQVNSGKPYASNCICGINSNTQVFVRNSVDYKCLLFDSMKNPVTVSDAESIYKIDFSCYVQRTYDSKTSQLTFTGNKTKNTDDLGFTCSFSPSSQGIYLFSASILSNKTIENKIPFSNNVFTAYSTLNFSKMNYLDYTQSKYIAFNETHSNNIVVKDNGYLISFDFLDFDGKSIGANEIGLHPSFNINDFTGYIYNPHDTENIKYTPVNFVISSDKIISVLYPNSNFFVKSSFPYILTIKYSGNPENDPSDIIRNKWVKIKNIKTQKCVKISNSSGVKLLQEECTNNEDSLLLITNHTDNSYFISSTKGLVWDNSGSRTENGNMQISYNKHGGENQRWLFEFNSNNYWIIKNKQSKKCFDLNDGISNNGIFLQQWDCTTGKNTQQWQIEEVGIRFSFYTQLENNVNSVCSHSMLPENSLIKSNGIMNIPVNQNTKLASIILMTKDSNYLNYLVDISKVFLITFLPIDNLTNPTFEIVRDVIVGTYSLKVNSIKAGTFNYSISIKSDKLNSTNFKQFNSSISILPDSNVGIIEKADLSQFKDNVSNILFDKTNDDIFTIDLIFKDSYQNILRMSPSSSNNNLGLKISVNINNKPFGVNWDSNTMNIIYSNGIYKINDYFKFVGNYYITISTKFGNSVVFTYSKEPGKVNLSKSSVTFTSNELKVGDSSAIAMTLLDSYSQNLLTGNKNTKAAALSAILISIGSINFSKFTEAELTFVSNSDPISDPIKLNINVLSNNIKLNCWQNCIQTVTYSTIDFQKTAVNIIAGGVTALSKTTAQKIVNKSNDLLLNFIFYNSLGKQLNKIDPSLISKINCKITGSGNFTVNLVGTVVNNAYIYFTFDKTTRDYSDYTSAVFGDYQLLATYKNSNNISDTITLTYPLNLIGDGEANDAGNGDIVLSKTFLSPTTLNNLAGLDGTINLEFRTSENKRYNQFDIQFLSNFAFNISIPDKSIDQDLNKIKIEKGIKIGTYILSINSKLAHYSPNGVTVTVLYKSQIIPTNILFYNTHNELSFLKIKENILIAKNSTTLIDGSTVSTYEIIIEAYDKYYNKFLQIFDQKIWSLDRIQRLLSLTHNNPQAVLSVAIVLNPNDNFVMRIDCSIVGRVDINSSFLSKTYSLNFLPGPLSSKSFATIITPSVTAGSVAQIKIFPLDMNSNLIPLSKLNDGDINNLKVLVDQPLSGYISAALTNNGSDNSLTYQVQLKKNGINTFWPTFSLLNLTCINCQVKVNNGPISFNNSQLYLNTQGSSILQSINNTINIKEKTYPSFSLYLLDEFNNKYNYIPDNLNFDIKWYFNNKTGNLTLQTSKVNDALSIVIGEEDFKDAFDFLLVGDYDLVITKINITDNKTEILNYIVKLVGDPPDPNASNENIDPSQTYVSKSSIQTIAGQIEVILLELRTKQGKRKNYFFNNTNSIILSLTQDNDKMDNYYKKIIRAEKPGQYFIQISSKKSYSITNKNQINIYINGTLCDKINISYVVDPSIPTIGYILDSNNNRLNESSVLPDGNADNIYSFKMVLVDNYNNTCKLSAENLNYKIESPEGKSCLSCISTVSMNPDFSFTVNYSPTTTGIYKITSTFMNEKVYTFNSLPGSPTLNSRANVPKTLKAGDSVSIYILPFDKNNNLIDALTIDYKKIFNVFVKWIEDGQFVKYNQITNPPIIVSTTLNNSTLNYIQYNYTLIKRDQNFFRITLGTTNEINCDNCVTTVTPGDQQFQNFLLQRYDSDLGQYVTITGDFSEQNEKSNPFYNLFPRDKFNNSIDLIDDLSLYSAFLVSGNVTVKFILGNQPGENDQIKFRNNETNIVLNPTLYGNLVPGLYTLNFIKKGIPNPLKFNVRIIGSGDSGDATNDPFDIRNVAIKDSNLNFLAGASGYFIIEMRTIINTRRNEDGYIIKPVPSILDDSFNYKVNQAGKKGQYYIAIFTNKANNYPIYTPYKLDIYIKAPNEATSVKSPLSLDLQINPETLVRTEILAKNLNPNSFNLINGTADNNLVFTLKGYDTFGNQANPKNDVLMLSVIDSSLNKYNFTSGIDVLNGLISYDVPLKLTGTYNITSPTFYDFSNNRIKYQYFNAPGLNDPKNCIISQVSRNVTAGEEALLKVIPRDMNENYITDKSILNNFTVSLTTPSNNNIDSSLATKSIETSQGINSFVFKVPLSEKGLNKWSLFYNNKPIDTLGSATNVNPSDISLEKSLVSITSNSGQYIVILNNGNSSNNNAIPFSIQIILRDKYFNLLDTCDDLLFDQISCVLSGNYMKPITFSKTKLSNKVVFTINNSDLSNYNNLVSGNNYEINILLKTNTSTYAQKIIQEITSNYNDTLYGNGDYIVAKTFLSQTKFNNINANSIMTFNIILYTETGKIYNRDIDLINNNKDYEYVVSPTPPNGSFSFNIYKQTTMPGVYKVDLKLTKITSIGGENNLQIKIRPINNNKENKENLTMIYFTVNPNIPPDSTRTIINSLPAFTNSSNYITINFKLYDQFGNNYTKNTLNLSNLYVIRGDIPVQNIRKEFINDTYEFSFNASDSYPPRNLSFAVKYSDSMGNNLKIHETNLTTYILSPFDLNKTVYSGSNLKRMKAGDKLDLKVYLKDSKNYCVDTDDKIIMNALIQPITASISQQTLSYNFTLNKNNPNSNVDCNNFYTINIPDNSNYVTIGDYSITLIISGNIIDKFNQTITPNVIDISQFVSTWTVKGSFNPYNVIAGTFLSFEIQSFDKFKNKLTDPIPSNLNGSLVATDGSNLSSNDYKIIMSQNTMGLMSGVLRINKTGSFNFYYSYNNIILTEINNIQGPNQIIVYPGPCSEKNNNTELNNFRLGENAFLAINCYDENNNKIFKGGEIFKTTINAIIQSSGVYTKIATKFVDNGNGSYNINFIPLYPGNYTIGITLASKGTQYGPIITKTIDSTQPCDSDKPIRCPNNNTECQKNFIDCYQKNSCSNQPLTPISCLVNNRSTCVKSQVECDCPVGYIKCDYMNVCVPISKDFLCSFNLQLDCKKLFPKKPYFCPDGICRASKDDCPSQRVCPYGLNLCPDLSCQKDRSNCNSYDDCHGDQIKCPDQTCVKNQKDCPSSITCSDPNKLVCPDGKCVSSDIECAAVPVCNPPINILCSINTCSNNINNCPKSVTCGHGKSLCTDIICKDSC